MTIILLTVFHVLLSLVGLGAGIFVLYGLLGSRLQIGWTFIFLVATAAVSLTGFLFPFHRFLPSHVIGLLSVIALTVASVARYRYHLAGRWFSSYVITAVLALYFNLFVLIVQLFLKVPFLNAIAPTQTEPPFLVSQLSALILFTFLGFRAVNRVQHPKASTA